MAAVERKQEGCGSLLSEGSRAECVLALGCARVEPLVFAGEVEAPVLVDNRRW
jgi:hypothetical protein